MSIRYGLLSLLREGPMYGYQLRAGFEGVTGGMWPLNIGQVYSTLGRLARDGLVEAQAPGPNGQQPFALTEAGRQEVEDWFLHPQPASERPRDELSIKIALAMSTPGIDARAVIQRQRTATMRDLQEHTRLLAHDDVDLAWRVVLERLIAELDGQLQWLDRCDELLDAGLVARPAARTAMPDAGAAGETAQIGQAGEVTQVGRTGEVTQVGQAGETAQIGPAGEVAQASPESEQEEVPR